MVGGGVHVQRGPSPALLHQHHRGPVTEVVRIEVQRQQLRLAREDLSHCGRAAPSSPMPAHPKSRRVNAFVAGPVLMVL